MCVSLSVCAQQTGQSDQFKTVKARDFKFDVHVPRGSLDMKICRKGAWPWSRDPLNFWALNTNSSKTVKATDFKLDRHVSRNSPDMTFFRKGSVFKNSLLGDMHSYSCYAVIFAVNSCSRSWSWVPDLGSLVRFTTSHHWLTLRFTPNNQKMFYYVNPIVPFKIVSDTSCGMTIFMRCSNSLRISNWRIGDSANPPTRNRYSSPASPRKSEQHVT